jgi:hypothetical protein
MLVFVGEELLNVDAGVAARGGHAKQLIDDEPHVQRESPGPDIDRRAVVADILELA